MHTAIYRIIALSYSVCPTVVLKHGRVKVRNLRPSRNISVMKGPRLLVFRQLQQFRPYDVDQLGQVFLVMTPVMDGR